MNLVGEKGQKHRTRLDISGSQLIVSWVSIHQASKSGADVIHKPPLKKEWRKEFLGREQCGQRDMGITWGKMKQESVVSLLYHFLGVSTPENKYMEIEALVVLWHLILPVISSLWTLPWVQSIISLMIAPGSPFMGRLTCFIAANSQMKHGMSSWWLMCRPSPKHGIKVGSGRIATY